MKLYAISDLHVAAQANRGALLELADHGDDWLIVAGDVAEAESEIEFAFDVLQARFQKLIWTPGNHELWTVTPNGLRGEAKYRALVALCRRRGIITPEDPYITWTGEGAPHIIAPLFLLYDYTFCPENVSPRHAVAWAAETGVVCTDEALLHPDPYSSRADWCHARCEISERRLASVNRESTLPLVIVNHYPLKRALARTPAIPRFQVWCGTRRTEDWHKRYRASVVVSGHLHIRQTTMVDAVRFEEVSFGYPSQRRGGRPLDTYLRQILPLASGA